MKETYLKIIYKVLAFYARKVVYQHKPKIIAVTGSVGKTSTKEAIYQVLYDQFGDKVRKNEGNLNAEIGVPLTILGYKKVPSKFVWPFFLLAAYFRTRVKKYPEYLILEMGVERKGDIKYLTSIAQPDIAIITSVSPAHIANFSEVSDYQKEKISLIGQLKENGVALVNKDDANLAEISGENIKSIGITNKTSDYRAEDIKISIEGTSYRIGCVGHKIAIKTKIIGKQLIYSELFAFAVADLLKIYSLTAAKSIEKINSVPGRMNILEGKRNIVIIDDSYNSNPTSMKAALDALAEIEYNHRKIAIIGNMNELGKFEKEGHREIGEYARGRCDLAIFVGPNADVMKKSYGNEFANQAFKNRSELIDQLDNIINDFDLILVKASQNNNFFEEVVKKLLKNPARANQLLVRQSKFWLRKKHI